jgi:hypothetical protein
MKIFTVEHRAKLSNARLGKSLSEETKQKIILANTGSHRSQETRLKMSIAHKGKPWTEARRIAQEAVTRKDGSKGTKRCFIGGREYPTEWVGIRRAIYERDNWTCQECGCKCLDKRRKLKGRKIQCHHIDYNIDNCEGDNLITLCASCHMKTNFNRDDWFFYYKQKVMNNGE